MDKQSQLEYDIAALVARLNVLVARSHALGQAHRASLKEAETLLVSLDAEAGRLRVLLKPD